MVDYFPTPETVEAFTCGDCWNLARTLRKMTGKRLVFANPDPEDQYYWEHVGLEVRRGLVLDIEGLHTTKNWRARWADGRRWRPGKGVLAYADDDTEIAGRWLEGLDLMYPETRPYRPARRLLETHAPHLLTPTPESRYA